MKTRARRFWNAVVAGVAAVAMAATMVWIPNAVLAASNWGTEDDLTGEYDYVPEKEDKKKDTSTSKLDVVLVLDTSGSMYGSPMYETIEAANSFVDTVLSDECNIGVVSYNNYAEVEVALSQDATEIKNAISNLYADGQTNIDDGLTYAEQMLENSTAKKKIIVLMSDGEPNQGREGDSLIAYADEIKAKGISIYTLGFFEYADNPGEAQWLMEQIASDGYHYEVDDAANLVYFFGDIADQVQGTKYIYIRIACPVDVRVEFDGEVLTSKDTYSSQRTSFGTITFEENTQYYDSTDNRIKVLRLRDGSEYDIRIEGNGTGKMNYSIGFMNADGEYKDVREFTDIEISPDTVVDTVAKRTKTTVLKIDYDGDGNYDETLKKSGASYGSSGSGNADQGSDVGVIVLWVVIGVVAAAGIGVAIFLILKKGKKNPGEVTEDSVSGQFPVDGNAPEMVGYTIPLDTSSDYSDTQG